MDPLVPIKGGGADNLMARIQQECNIEAKDADELSNLLVVAAVGTDPAAANAQFWLGVCYQEGVGVAADTLRAATLIEQAAGNGHAFAKKIFAQALIHGKAGIERDEARAVTLLEKCQAEEWTADAAFFLGSMYLLGTGCEKNVHAGITNLLAASRAGHVSAHRMLAICFRDGCGVAKDDKQAAFYAMLGGGSTKQS
jgi:TPR repeat protein